MRRFLWDSLQEARNRALGDICLSGDLPQAETLASQSVDLRDIGLTAVRPAEALSAGPGLGPKTYSLLEKLPRNRVSDC